MSEIIKEIIESDCMLVEKVKRLNQLAYDSRDKDDFLLFDLVKESFERLSSNRRLRFVGNYAFNLMYEDRIKIVIFHEKHGDMYYFVHDVETFCKVFLSVFQQRIQEGWYEDYPELSGNERVDARAAFNFLLSHKEHEYEDFDIEYTVQM